MMRFLCQAIRLLHIEYQKGQFPEAGDLLGTRFHISHFRELPDLKMRPHVSFQHHLSPSASRKNIKSGRSVERKSIPAHLGKGFTLTPPGKGSKTQNKNTKKNEK